MSPYRLVLADDHVMLRQGLKRLIEESREMIVVGEVADGLELISLLNKTVPDMIVLDISMPKLRGLEAICEIKSRHLGVKVLILTMHREKEYLYQAISSGANGYILKEDADTELFSAIQRIRQGRIYVSPSLSDELAEFFVQQGHRGAVSSCETDRLTTREREIVKLIAEERSSREIADLLGISARTVERHRANIMEKLHLKNTAALVKYAISKGHI